MPSTRKKGLPYLHKAFPQYRPETMTTAQRTRWLQGLGIFPKNVAETLAKVHRSGYAYHQKIMRWQATKKREKAFKRERQRLGIQTGERPSVFARSIVKKPSTTSMRVRRGPDVGEQLLYASLVDLFGKEVVDAHIWSHVNGKVKPDVYKGLASGGLQRSAYAIKTGDPHFLGIGNSNVLNVWEAKAKMKSIPDTCFRAIEKVYTDQANLKNSEKRRNALLHVLQSKSCGLRDALHPDNDDDKVRFSTLSTWFRESSVPLAILASTNLSGDHVDMFRKDFRVLSQYFSALSEIATGAMLPRSQKKQILSRPNQMINMHGMMRPVWRR